MARVVLGVTGGIAAYKACELTRLLVRAGHDVTPVLTAEAEGFVAARTFEALARREQPHEAYPHLVDADLLVIAPLSANTLAKLARRARRQRADAAGARLPRPVSRRPGDERAHVGARSHPGQREDIASAGRGADRPGGRRARRGRGGHGADERARGDLRARARVARRVRHARGEDGARHRRRDARAARLGALRRQPLVGADGRRARRGGAQARGGGDAARGEPGGAGSCRGGRDRDPDRRRPGARGEGPRGRGRRPDGGRRRRLRARADRR